MNRIGAITAQGSLSMPRVTLDVHACLLQSRVCVALPLNRSARIIAAVLRTRAVRPRNGVLSCEPCPCHDRTCNVKRRKRVRIRRRKGLANPRAPCNLPNYQAHRIAFGMEVWSLESREGLLRFRIHHDRFQVTNNYATKTILLRSGSTKTASCPGVLVGDSGDGPQDSCKNEGIGFRLSGNWKLYFCGLLASNCRYLLECECRSHLSNTNIPRTRCMQHGVSLRYHRRGC